MHICIYVSVSVVVYVVVILMGNWAPTLLGISLTLPSRKVYTKRTHVAWLPSPQQMCLYFAHGILLSLWFTEHGHTDRQTDIQRDFQHGHTAALTMWWWERRQLWSCSQTWPSVPRQQPGYVACAQTSAQPPCDLYTPPTNVVFLKNTQRLHRNSNDPTASNSKLFDTNSNTPQLGITRTENLCSNCHCPPPPPKKTKTTKSTTTTTNKPSTKNKSKPLDKWQDNPKQKQKSKLM